MLYLSYYDSPIGQALLAAKNDALVGLWIKGQKYFFGSLKEESVRRDNEPVLVEAKLWLDRYFTGKNPRISELKLEPMGSEFRMMVWHILCKIPYGKTTTYGEIANKIAELRGFTVSAQAVGGAVGHNPISIIIPCHRVIGANGSLTGYAGGVDKKAKLLALEGVHMENLYIPTKGAAL